ncbi:MAG: DUF2240 family protein [Candidatus Woesearchaeota archaeon]
MLNLSYEKIVEIIKEKSGLSEEEITKRINEKISQLSDLVSKEGAAHIVANQLGISLISVEKKIKIHDLNPGMRGVEVVGRVVKKFELREFNVNERIGKVASFFIGDETGTIRVALWGEIAETLRSIQEGDIVKIKNGYVKLNNNFKELHLGDKSLLLINPEGETIKEIKRRFDKKYLCEVNEGDNVEIIGTIVQIFDPRFFELCPECMKRARQKEEGFFCEIHGKIENPKHSYVFNIVVDDGTDNIRVILYKQQAERVLQREENEILSAKDDNLKMDIIKSEIFGKTIKVCGLIKQNQFFDRKELIAQLVFPELNVEEEIKILEEDLAKKQVMQS